jgi:hypothetical protein
LKTLFSTMRFFSDSGRRVVSMHLSTVTGFKAIHTSNRSWSWNSSRPDHSALPSECYVEVEVEVEVDKLSSKVYLTKFDNRHFHHW